MNEQTISVAEAKKNLSDLLGKVAYGKKRIIITKRGRPMACLVPAETQERHLGDVKGWLNGDDPFFDTMDSIVKNRTKHAPRILKKHPEK